MKALLIFGVAFCLTVLAFHQFVPVSETIQEDSEEEPKFQGPVPRGYDQEYFWETGKLIKEVNS